ncbi:MAG: hypothetical protein RMY16_24840 [Nostoc sp. DedQUE12b]|uniref:hypothetical protein n=1 Tax=Nostoc sp. DedQUE12b TaxID=3075398 RepID=UPI002AD29BC9|nr:hypothetical protein [Nostoc sp. DedQUE12b]MDZ8088754.1 hypothetical protein [Nostoc sp. DedQUE12b]
MTEEKQVVSTTVSTGENETVKATAVTTGGKSDGRTSQPKVFIDKGDSVEAFTEATEETKE